MRPGASGKLPAGELVSGRTARAMVEQRPEAAVDRVVEYTTPRQEEMAFPTRINGFDGNDIFNGGMSPDETKLSRRERERVWPRGKGFSHLKAR